MPERSVPPIQKKRQLVDPISYQAVRDVTGRRSPICANVEEILDLVIGVGTVVDADVPTDIGKRFTISVMNVKREVAGEALAHRTLQRMVDGARGIIDVVAARYY